MMHYKKGKNIEEELSKEKIPIECLPKDFLWMHVKGGTKVSNVIEYAKKAFDNGEYRSVVWTGSGGGVTKTISCAEIMKRSYPLHQITRICFRKVEEYWEPLLEGLEEIVANREIPCVHILLSLDEIDPKTPGYQHSTTTTPVWDKNKEQGGNHDTPGGSMQPNRGNRNQNQQNRRRKPKPMDRQKNTQNVGKKQNVKVMES